MAVATRFFFIIFYVDFILKVLIVVGGIIAIYKLALVGLVMNKLRG